MSELERKPGGGSAHAKGMKEVYPSEFVGARSYRDTDPSGYTPREVAEPRAISCQQCNYQIRDASAVKTCPNCGSDNFEGKASSR